MAPEGHPHTRGTAPIRRVQVTVAVLGAGPHGRQLAHDLDANLYDDYLPSYRPVRVGASEWPWVAGAVWPSVRRRIADHVADLSDPLDDGLVQFPTAYVGCEVTVGQHVHLLPHSAISHGCRLGDFVTVATGAVLCGEVWVEDDVFIGAGAVIIHGGIKIGAGAVIGAGVTIKRDVAPGEVVK